MQRYKQFQKNLINYNFISQYNYTNINQLPKLKNISINFKDKIIKKDLNTFLEYRVAAEFFVNGPICDLHSKKRTTSEVNQTLIGYEKIIKQIEIYNFLEFLNIFVFPKQITMPKFIFTKVKDSEVILAFHIKDWTNTYITDTGIDLKTKPVKITIKIFAKSIEEAKSLVNLLNFPYISV